MICDVGKRARSSSVILFLKVTNRNSDFGCQIIERINKNIYRGTLGSPKNRLGYGDDLCIPGGPIGFYIPCGFTVACGDIDLANQRHGMHKPPINPTNLKARSMLVRAEAWGFMRASKMRCRCFSILTFACCTHAVHACGWWISLKCRFKGMCMFVIEFTRYKYRGIFLCGVFLSVSVVVYGLTRPRSNINR